MSVRIDPGLSPEEMVRAINANFRRRARRDNVQPQQTTVSIVGGGGAGGAVDPWYTLTYANPLPIDGANGDKQRVTVTADTVLQDPVNFVNGEPFRLRLQMNGSGGWNVTFADPSLWEIPSASYPLFALPNKTINILWIFDGTKMLLGSMPFIT